MENMSVYGQVIKIVDSACLNTFEQVILMQIITHLLSEYAFNGGWDYRTLQRQYDSSVYERLALSRNKETVLHLPQQ